MDWLKIDGQEYDELLDYDSRALRSKIIDYVIWMKDEKKLSSSSIKIRIAALHHFYNMVEYESLKWKIIGILNFVILNISPENSHRLVTATACCTRATITVIITVTTNTNSS